MKPGKSVIEKYYLHCVHNQEYSEIDTYGCIKTLFPKEVGGMSNGISKDGWYSSCNYETNNMAFQNYMPMKKNPCGMDIKMNTKRIKTLNNSL